MLFGVLGAGSFSTGVVAVFISQNGTGTGVLLVVGAAVLFLTVLGNRIESLEFGGARLRLRAAAAQRYALAEESEHRGDVAEADRLRQEARAFMDAARPIAASYRSVRDSLPSSPERTKILENIVLGARRLAEKESFEAVEVAHWLRQGNEEERITALAMMQAKPELRDFEAMIAAIREPRSAFEQYHALKLAVVMLEDLEPAQRLWLAATVRSIRGLRFRQDSERRRLGEVILQRAE
ncbi:hypothetical protein [Micromonospora sp. NPDC047074]|uniref:hypothetical protein n=1 Tax=Micromonospora sp. NPDC047074 TaxID=3154339 RepID=UPI0033C3754E